MQPFLWWKIVYLYTVDAEVGNVNLKVNAEKRENLIYTERV